MVTIGLSRTVSEINGDSRFDTILACDGHPPSHPASHVAVASTRYAIASRLKIVQRRISIFTVEWVVSPYPVRGNASKSEVKVKVELKLAYSWFMS